MLSFFTSDVVLVPPDQLHVPNKRIPAELLKRLKHCHIYLIGRRPRISFDPSTFNWDGEFASGLIIRSRGGRVETTGFKVRLGLADGGTVAVGPYPFTELVELLPDGSEVSRWRCSLAAMRATLDDRSFVDLEVVYVGMAYGKGDRSAFDRLRSHDTLQQVLAETSIHSPDTELMLLMFKYEGPTLHTSIDGRVEAQIDGEEDREHFLSLIDNPVTERQKIGLVEAGLIRYFSPEYNEKFKNQFPIFGQKVLDDCYKLDFIGLSVEINTEELPLKIWSQTRESGHHHIAHFDLHDRALRRSFFSYLDENNPPDLSGPLF